jgi:hypothetical protein
MEKLPERPKFDILHARSSGIDEDVKEEAHANLDWGITSESDDDNSTTSADEVASNGSEISPNDDPMSRGDQEPEIESSPTSEDLAFHGHVDDPKVSLYVPMLPRIYPLTINTGGKSRMGYCEELHQRWWLECRLSKFCNVGIRQGRTS